MTEITPGDRAELRKQHWGVDGRCVLDDEDWPCTVERLLDALEAAEEQIAAVHAATDAITQDVLTRKSDSEYVG